MPLLHLPHELLWSLAEILESETDINAFTQTNRRLYNLLNTYLYRHNIQQSRISALLWAAKRGQDVTTRKLLEEGAEPDSEDNYRWTPPLRAAEKGREEVVKLLLEKDAELETKASNGWTPLLWAAMNGHEGVVELLLEKGAELETKSSGSVLRIRFASNVRKRATESHL
jgi:ankyrin repeat protein